MTKVLACVCLCLFFVWLVCAGKAAPITVLRWRARRGGGDGSLRRGAMTACGSVQLCGCRDNGAECIIKY